MAIVIENIVPAKQVENTQTTQYTSSGVKTIIDKFTVTNTSASDVAFTCHLVALGDAAGDSNKVVSRTILAGKTDRFPELVGQVLEDGDFISTLAGAASSLTLRVSGRKIS